MSIKYLTLITVLLCTILSIGNSQRVNFEELAPISEVSINDLFVSQNNDLYMTTPSGLYRSTDEGTTWAKRTLPDNAIVTKVVYLESGQAIFRSYRGDYIYNIANGWIKFPQPDSTWIGFNFGNSAIATLGEEVIVEGSQDNVFISDKFGENRRELELPETPERIIDIKTSENKLHVIILNDDFDFKVFIYNRDYELINTYITPSYSENRYLVTDSLIVSGRGDDIYISDDNGLSFKSREVNIRFGSDINLVDNSIYFTNYNSQDQQYAILSFLVKDINNPAIWTLDTLVELKEKPGLHSANNVHMFVTTEKALSHIHFNVDNDLDLKEPVLSGWNSPLNKLITKNENIYVSTDRHVYVSTDKGQNWDRLAPQLQLRVIDFDVSEEEEIIISSLNHEFGTLDSTYIINKNDDIASFENRGSTVYMTENESEYISINVSCGDIGGYIYSSHLDEIIGLQPEDCLPLQQNKKIIDSKLYLPFNSIGPVIQSEYGESTYLNVIQSKPQLEINQLDNPENWPTDFTFKSSLMDDNEIFYASGTNGFLTLNGSTGAIDLYDPISNSNANSTREMMFQRENDSRIIVLQQSNNATVSDKLFYQSSDTYKFEEVELTRDFRNVSQMAIDNEGAIYFIYQDRLLYSELDLPQLTAVESLTTEEVKLYPNPTTGIVSIDLPKGKWHKLEILNALGEQLAEQKVEQLQTTINLNQYDAGLFYVRLTSDEGDSLVEQIIYVD